MRPRDKRSAIEERDGDGCHEARLSEDVRHFKQRNVYVFRVTTPDPRARALDVLAATMYIQCRYMAAVTTQIARWGNSLGLRLPKSVARDAEVGEGDTVDVTVRNGAIVIRPSRPTYSLERLVAKITPRNRHGETDWGAPVGHETW